MDENKSLKIKANELRVDIINMLKESKSGHTASPLGMSDIFAVLYFKPLLRFNAKKPDWDKRDYLILSCGHYCPILYAAMAKAGYFPKKELNTLRKLNSRLQGHPHNTSLPGIENSSGPLGQGVSQAVGLAKALKIDKKSNKVFCIGSDGEMQEGQVWEALNFASNYNLDNFIYILDRNHIQIDGPTEEVMEMEPIDRKLLASNFHVLEMDGNNMDHILKTIKRAKTLRNKPIAIIAHTIPGKGVSFMEQKYEWHGKTPDEEQAKKAIEELNEIRANIK